MTDSTLTPPAADMMSFLSTTPEHKDSEYETPVSVTPINVMRAAPVHSPLATARLWRYPVMDCSGEVVRTVNRPLAWR